MFRTKLTMFLWCRSVANVIEDAPNASSLMTANESPLEDGSDTADAAWDGGVGAAFGGAKRTAIINGLV